MDFTADVEGAVIVCKLDTNMAVSSTSSRGTSASIVSPDIYWIVNTYGGEVVGELKGGAAAAGVG